MTNPSPISQVADASVESWVYRSAPNRLKPYLKLARLDRPVGAGLLLWPCLWSLLLASETLGLQTLWLGGLFALGSVVMRGAGCAYNDIVDRDFDKAVARTANRPIPAGEISVKAAYGFTAALCLVGLIVLVQLNPFSIALGASSLLLVAAYPFMKRITFWPQAWLGLTFNWGALLGASAVIASVPDYALLVYAGCLCWTLGYDTIYAHQDKEDDALIGVKSTALKFGDKTKVWLGLFYMLFIIALVGAGALAKTGAVYYVSAAFVALQLMWQVKTVNIDDPALCLAVFKSNNRVGLLFCAGLVADRLVA